MHTIVFLVGVFGIVACYYFNLTDEIIFRFFVFCALSMIVLMIQRIIRFRIEKRILQKE